MPATDDDSRGRPPRPILKLYVTGGTPRAALAVANLRRICEEAVGKDYDLTVIDVLEQPHLAEEDRVLVTPTVIKQLPPPPRKILGDLTDTNKVLAWLQLESPRSDGS